MKNNFKKILMVAVGFFAFSNSFSQNVSLNMLVLNSGIVPVGGPGTLKATVNATPGSGGQITPVVSGKVNISITVPPSVIISPIQNNIPAGWTIRNNDGVVINICNSSTTIAINTALDILIDLQGVTVTSGAPTMSGQITFKTNCTAPGSLSGDNPSDNSGQAGFSVTNTTPVTLVNFTASLINCEPVLNWVTETEINSDRFEIERAIQNSSEWAFAGSVTASGNVFTKTKYQFADDNINTTAKKILYRLKIIDKDGHFKYSEILPVFINCKTVDVHVYPNPVQSGSLKVSITGAGENIKASLLSASGQLVLKGNLINGTNSINLSNVANGEYILKVDFEDGGSKQIKVVVQK